MNRNSRMVLPLQSLLLLAIGFILLTTQTGCNTTDQRFGNRIAQKIKPGVTTRQEVLNEFGKPCETTSGEGRTLLFYEWVISPTFQGQPAQFYCLSVLCEANDKVLRTHPSYHWIDFLWGYESVSGGSLVTEGVKARLHPNETTREQAIRLLGPPVAEKLSLKGDRILIWEYWSALRKIRPTNNGQMLQVYLDWDEWRVSEAADTQHSVIRLVFNDADVLIGITGDMLR